MTMNILSFSLVVTCITLGSRIDVFHLLMYILMVAMHGDVLVFLTKLITSLLHPSVCNLINK